MWRNMSRELKQMTYHRKNCSIAVLGLPINLLPISNITELISRSICSSLLCHENILFHSVSVFWNIRMYFPLIFFMISFFSHFLQDDL